MLKDKRPHGIGVALGTDRELSGSRPNLVAGLRAVRVVAVTALHQSRIDPVTVGPRELRFLRAMAPEAKLCLRFDEHEIHIGRLMRAVTRSATDAVRQMLGLGEILRLQAGLVAFGTDGGSLSRRQSFEADNFTDIATAVHMRLRRAVAGLAAMLVTLEEGRMRCGSKMFFPDLLVAGLADVGFGVLAAAGSWKRCRCLR